MSQVLLISGCPGPGFDLFARLVDAHPALSIDPPLQVPEIHAQVQAAAADRARHPDQPWSQAPAWMQPALDGWLQLLLQPTDPGASPPADCSASYARDPGTWVTRLPDARIFVAWEDPRSWMAGAAPTSENLAYAVRQARAWVAHIGPASTHPAVQLVDIPALRRAPNRALPALFDALSLPSLPSGVAREVLHASPAPPTGDVHPALDTAFRSVSGVDTLLRRLELPPPPLCAWPQHPDVAEARAETLAAQGQPLNAAITLTRWPRLTAKRAGLLHAAGRTDLAARSLQAHLGRCPEDVAAWRTLFSLSGDAPLPLLATARQHEALPVRQALTRWLVSRGLDEEAAETVADTALTPWHQPD